MNTSTYRLAIDGDDFERHCWNLFVKDQFPSYERFWLKFVVPLTNRPNNVHFKTDADLATISKLKSDLCIAQLNYSVLRHLMRCFEVLKALENPIGIDQQLNLLLEGMVRLSGAQDNAFELLERAKNPSNYQPFAEKDGKTAREAWQKNQNYPLQNLRDYRNSLIHGRLLPRIIDGSRLCLPEIGKVNLYLDWRIITDPSNNPGLDKAHFISVLNISEFAWKETVNYLESNWKNL